MIRNSGIEIIVGMPSHMEADSIGFVTKQVDMGLQKYFSNYNSIIVNVDNCSDDNTKGAFLLTDTITPKKYISTREGVLGKGNNFLNLFKYGIKYKSTLAVIVVVDSDLKSITPEWIKFLVEPILGGNDYALPRYSRHQFDGTITNHICHPLLYGLLGENVRQPIGGDFSFSPSLMEYWLNQKWLPTTKQYGIDIFMTMNAIIGKFKICEVGLGAKIHKASAPKLGPMFTQVVNTLFDKITSNRETLLSKKIDLKSKPQFGLKELALPQNLQVDIKDLKKTARREYFEKEKLLKKYLDNYTFNSVKEMVEMDRFDMDIIQWTHCVYQLLFAFDRGTSSEKKNIVETLKPLYFMRSISFDYKTWNYNIKSAEREIAKQAEAFHSLRPYFNGLYL